MRITKFTLLVSLLITCCGGTSSLFAQYTGIGTENPTHTLHIKPIETIPGQEALRIEGLQLYRRSSDDALLIVDPDSGVVRVIPLDSLITKFNISIPDSQPDTNLYQNNGSLTDNRTINLNGNRLSISSNREVIFDPEGNIDIGGNISIGQGSAFLQSDVGLTQFMGSDTLQFKASDTTGLIRLAPDRIDLVNGDSAWLQLGSSGIKLPNFGKGEISGNETYLLGIDSVGKLVEVNKDLNLNWILGDDDVLYAKNTTELGFPIVISREGRLGLGTSNPTRALDMRGDAKLYNAKGTQLTEMVAPRGGQLILLLKAGNETTSIDKFQIVHMDDMDRSFMAHRNIDGSRAGGIGFYSEQFFVSENPFDTTESKKIFRAHFNSGKVGLPQYGKGEKLLGSTSIGNSPFTYLLGIQEDGDIFELDTTTLASSLPFSLGWNGANQELSLSLGNKTQSIPINLSFSDIRLKRDLQPISNATSSLLKIRGYQYSWKKDEYPEMGFDTKPQLGVIAQEVEAFFPELILEDDKGWKTVDYEGLIPVLIEAFREQQVRIEELEQSQLQLAEETQRIDMLWEELSELKAQLRSESTPHE